MKRIICIALVLSLLCLPACKQEENATYGLTPGPVETDPVLAARRDSAEAYMRNMATIRWCVEEDLLYTIDSKATPEGSSPDKQMLLKAGRIYQGVPYSYAGSSAAAFLDYSTAQSGGIHTIADLDPLMLSGNSKKARIGNDGSSALTLSWVQMGAILELSTSTPAMVPMKGYHPVGNFQVQVSKL